MNRQLRMIPRPNRRTGSGIFYKFIKNTNSFKQNYYFIGKDECEQLEKLAMEFYPVAFKSFKKAFHIILDEYKPAIPSRLYWQMGNILSYSLGNFVTCSLYEGMRNKDLSMPDNNNKEWLSLFASVL